MFILVRTTPTDKIKASKFETFEAALNKMFEEMADTAKRHAPIFVNIITSTEPMNANGATYKTETMDENTYAIRWNKIHTKMLKNIECKANADISENDKHYMWKIFYTDNNITYVHITNAAITKGDIYSNDIESVAKTMFDKALAYTDLNITDIMERGCGTKRKHVYLKHKHIEYYINTTAIYVIDTETNKKHIFKMINKKGVTNEIT